MPNTVGVAAATDKVLAVVSTRAPLSNTAPAYKLPPTPAPPATVNAPVVVDVAEVALVILIALVVVKPLSVTVCKLLVFHTVTVPVFALTAVSVPAVSVCTP